MDNAAVSNAIQIAAPLIPFAISFIEQIFGGGGGGQKKQAAVNLIQSGLTTIANAGKIPSAGVVDPALPAALGDAVQKVFDQISVNGKVPPLPAAAGPAIGQSVAPPNAKPLVANVASGAGRTFLVIELP